MNIVLRVLPGLVAAAMAMAPTSSRAVLIPAGAVVNPCNFSATYGWVPVAANDAATLPAAPGGGPNFWKADINTVANGANIDVTASIKHDTGAGCGGPNNDPINLRLNSVVPAANQAKSKVTAAQVDHGGAIDVGVLKTTVQPAQNAISSVAIAGQHFKNGIFPVGASFTNDSTRVFKKVEITPDYTDDLNPAVRKDGPTINAVGPAGLKPGDSLKQALPPGLAGNPTFFLSSYRIEASSSPPTTTDLAFLGDVNGTFGELNLGAMLDLMLGTNEMLAPFLRPLIGDDTDPLYVAIDLTQWVGLAGSFHIGDVFNLVDGMSDLLPGLLVGRSPITLGADGYHTDNAYNGDVVAVATIDGKVPEPQALALVVLALAVLVASRRAKRPAPPAFHAA